MELPLYTDISTCLETDQPPTIPNTTPAFECDDDVISGAHVSRNKEQQATYCAAMHWWDAP